MITVSENAQKEINSVLNGKDQKTLRVYLAPGDSAGPYLGLVVDTVNDEDKTCDVNGISYCINKNLQAHLGVVAIELDADGNFVLTPEIPLPKPTASACSSCSSSSGCSSKSTGGCASLFQAVSQL